MFRCWKMSFDKIVHLDISCLNLHLKHIIRNWSFAVFYVMAEMWGSVVASLLFWSFANEVTTVEEAKKYCE